MPEAGGYLLVHVGFSPDEKPIISLQKAGDIINFVPSSKTLTLKFDMSARFCAGWYDLRTKESHICPEGAAVGEKYEQCPACQKRTGFNPAFYHATSVSEQQEERNREPHFLYLAHFGESIVKIGISHAARGNSRLLEQGARSALILETFPTAHIARQYEAKIAALSNIVETVQLRKKIAALTQNYDAQEAKNELARMRGIIEKTLGVTFEQNHTLSLDALFFPGGLPDLSEAHDCSDNHLISGKVIGMLGSLLFCEQRAPLFLPLKKHVGYHVELSYDETEIMLPAKQTSLF